ncbi:MAG: hypothetical protein O8C63_01690 [Candidatus Methanoperedens sp.]|nr:hypothetical protein [Candidatus Methanoperedens sp.]
MPLEGSNWIKEVEDELRTSFYKRILWAFILIISALALYFSNKISLTFGLSGNPIALISILLGFIAIVNIISSPKHPDYLAYYLYQTGSEILNFENKENYLKKNQNYIKNCREQLLYLIGEGETDLRGKYFTRSIVDFLSKIYYIILRLNYIYIKENIDEKLMTKLDGMSSVQFINEREFISSNLIALANLIHRENSSLTQAHVDITNKISEELKDIPEEPFNKPFSEYVKEKIWNKLHYNLKIIIFLGTVFVTIFIILSQILIYSGSGQQSYTTAMLVSGGLTAAAFSKIDLFINRERIR